MSRSNRGSSGSARPVPSGCQAGNGGVPDQIGDEELLRICGAAGDDSRITSACKADLRASSALISAYAARHHRLLSVALALLTVVLAQLSPWTTGPVAVGAIQAVVQTAEYVDRSVLESAAVRIASLHWLDVEPEIVTLIVRSGVTGAVRLGFLAERDCPGHRSVVGATPSGITRARQLAAAATGTVHAAPPIASKVQLGAPGEPCRVLGKPKPALTDAQHAVVTALIAAGDTGMRKDSLEDLRPSARRILRQLRQDRDWAAVISMPGQTNGRYRIRT